MAGLIRSDSIARTPSHRRYLDARSERIGRIRGLLSETFPDPVKVTLEFGCGHGHYLTAYAEQHPEAQCVGIDLVSKRITKARQKRDKRNLGNLHFLKAEVTEVMEAWPDHLLLDRVFILFPDPWPKKRHAKNRILQSHLLDDLGRIASTNTTLHFRTDHEENFAWGLEVIASHPDWVVRDDLEWPLENPSYFQELLGVYQSLTASFNAP